MLTAAQEAEITALAARYGEPRRVDVALVGAAFDPLDRDDRYGEVCMVFRRPSGRILTAIKTYYPRGAFRLLTGGVAPGEAILEALHREVAEETGLDVLVTQFLAVIEYRFESPEARVFGERPADFATFAFLLDEQGGILSMNDPGEEHEQFREVDPDGLVDLSSFLAAIPDGSSARIGGSWRDWGRFRSVVHQVVAECLGPA